MFTNVDFKLKVVSYSLKFWDQTIYRRIKSELHVFKVLYIKCEINMCGWIISGKLRSKSGSLIVTLLLKPE